MERELRTPRTDWVAQCEAVDFSYHSLDGTYWDFVSGFLWVCHHRSE